MAPTTSKTDAADIVPSSHAPTPASAVRSPVQRAMSDHVRGMSFADGAKALSPVQMAGSSGGPADHEPHPPADAIYGTVVCDAITVRPRQRAGGGGGGGRVQQRAIQRAGSSNPNEDVLHPTPPPPPEAPHIIAFGRLEVGVLHAGRVNGPITRPSNPRGWTGDWERTFRDGQIECTELVVHHQE